MNNLMIGALSGLLANGWVGRVDAVLGRFVSDEQKRRERQVREASPHQVGGVKIARAISRREPSERGKRLAQYGFLIAYGIGWGLIYSTVRRKVPMSRRWLGLPFGTAFFAACDGMIAPLLRLSPSATRVPWQFNAKELSNHISWTAAAEVTHRALRPSGPGSRHRQP